MSAAAPAGPAPMSEEGGASLSLDKDGAAAEALETTARPQAEQPAQDASSQARRLDEDRWLASRFASRVARDRLTALYAVTAEIARAADGVAEPMLAQMRLTWWRSALEAMLEGRETAQPPSVRELAIVQQSVGFDRRHGKEGTGEGERTGVHKSGELAEDFFLGEDFWAGADRPGTKCPPRLGPNVGSYFEIIFSPQKASSHVQDILSGMSHLDASSLLHRAMGFRGRGGSGTRCLRGRTGFGRRAGRWSSRRLEVGRIRSRRWRRAPGSRRGW